LPRGAERQNQRNLKIKHQKAKLQIKIQNFISPQRHRER
jgi:uncharacterized membrane-anchored protein